MDYGCAVIALHLDHESRGGQSEEQPYDYRGGDSESTEEPAGRVRGECGAGKRKSGDRDCVEWCRPDEDRWAAHEEKQDE